MTANRVQPDGRFDRLPHRGAFMGNRGCLHDDAGTIRRDHVGKRWITCTLRVKPSHGKVPLAAPGRYTPLFFLDEAVAAAAGHRPCATCRRAAFNAFCAAWLQAFGKAAKADAIDRVLDAARLADGRQRHHSADLASLPFGAFILWQGQPHLVTETALLPYSPQGYGAARPRPTGPVTVLTPEPLVAVMTAGWRPLLSAKDDRPSW